MQKPPETRCNQIHSHAHDQQLEALRRTEMDSFPRLSRSQVRVLPGARNRRSEPQTRPETRTAPRGECTNSAHSPTGPWLRTRLIYIACLAVLAGLIPIIIAGFTNPDLLHREYSGGVPVHDIGTRGIDSPGRWARWCQEIREADTSTPEWAAHIAALRAGDTYREQCAGGPR